MGSFFVEKVEPTVAGAFQRFLERVLAISAEDRKRASASNLYLRETLVSRREKDPTFPRVLTTFLSGSYPRFTKNPPLDDIDIMAVLDGAGLYAKGDGIVLADTLEGSDNADNALVDLRYNDDEGGKSSIRVLNAFKAALDDEYEKSEIVRDGQAVNIWLSSYELGFDVVPCFHVLSTQGGSDYYLIPKGDGKPGWMATNPKFDAERVEAIDKLDRQNGQFRPTAKLVKRWNTERNRRRLRPYHLEVIALQVFDSYSITSYQDALEQFFSVAPDLLARPFPDPAGLGADVDRYLNDERRQLSLQAMTEALKDIRDARDHERFGRYEDAIAVWQRALGSDFPG